MKTFKGKGINRELVQEIIAAYQSDEVSKSESVVVTKFITDSKTCDICGDKFPIADVNTGRGWGFLCLECCEDIGCRVGMGLGQISYEHAIKFVKDTREINGENSPDTGQINEKRSEHNFIMNLFS